jgi:outer membrane receptor for ferric coprogen and ferric-rhodotorulic acid|uniref:Ferripyoverdine receptor n=1 Tax=Alcanivorax borkumensis (strain ATCC 700651 / DSM 11573 / NCIMB 13689 / SK2) TaxID=393595 RepID=Q0VLL4_ALCBS|nr:Ferripyoverdine receptor precursor [Alcanivorax borkumensis SK2]
MFDLRFSTLASLMLASGAAYSDTITDSEAHTLGDIHVSTSGMDKHDASMTTEGTDRYGTNATNTATRMVLSPRETPQSVSVITRQQMDDFNLNSVADVMRRTPGVTVKTLDTERLQLSARGFDITNFLYDGIPSTRAGQAKQAVLSDTFIYDRIEVLRGASGLLNGIGEPSATVNLVRKKPTRDFTGQVGVELNSWDGYRGEFDASGSLSNNGRVRGRFVSAYEQGDSFLDHYENDKQIFYGVVEADLFDNTLLTVGMDYMDHDPRGSTWGGIPLFYSDGGIADLDRDLNPATDWSRWARDTQTIFLNLEHHFENGWYSKFAYNNQQSNYDAQLASAGGGQLNRDGSGKTLWAGRYVETKPRTLSMSTPTGPSHCLAANMNWWWVPVIRTPRVITPASHRSVSITWYRTCLIGMATFQNRPGPRQPPWRTRAAAKQACTPPPASNPLIVLLLLPAGKLWTGNKKPQALTGEARLTTNPIRKMAKWFPTWGWSMT